MAATNSLGQVGEHSRKAAERDTAAQTAAAERDAAADTIRHLQASLQRHEEREREQQRDTDRHRQALAAAEQETDQLRREGELARQEASELQHRCEVLQKEHELAALRGALEQERRLHEQAHDDLQASHVSQLELLRTAMGEERAEAGRAQTRFEEALRTKYDAMAASLRERAEELQKRVDETGESNRIITQAMRIKQEELQEIQIRHEALERLHAEQEAERAGAGGAKDGDAAAAGPEVETDDADQVRAAGLAETNDVLWSFFIERVRARMHIVLCLSPIGEAYRNYVRMFPALVSCTTIDWFTDWRADAL